MENNSNFDDILLEFSHRYPARKYASKYPKLFSQNFEEYCNENIVPIFRKKLRFIKSYKHPKYALLRKITLICISCLVISYALIPIFQNAVIAVIAVISFLVTAIVGLVGNKTYFKLEKERKQRLKKEFETIKNEVLPLLFSFDDEIEYISSLTPKENKDFLLYNFHLGQLRGGIDINHRDDFFKIKYKKLEIEVREVLLSYYDENKFEQYKAKKKGGLAVVFSIKTFKSFYGRTSIVRRILEYKNDACKEEPLYNETILEDDDFNKLYKVLTTNPQEARLFLTPAFMVRLVNLTQKYPSLEIDISFERENINIIFCDAKDRFELFKWNDCMSYKDTNIDIFNYEVYRDILIDLKELLLMLDELQIENIL